MHVALFAPMGNMSLDSQVALLPYESCSFFPKGTQELAPLSLVSQGMQG
jgi:hypothetical protein